MSQPTFQGTQPKLLPWILAGLLIAAGAIPIGIALTGKTPVAPPTTAAVSKPSITSTTRVAAPVSVEAVPTPVAGRLAHPALPPGQVWECIVNGQKTFSDSPCGDGASIRQLSAVNGMDPTPAAPVAGYPPPGAGYYPYPASYSAGQDPPEANDGYAGQTAVIVGVARSDRRTRPRHPDRHSVHARN